MLIIQNGFLETYVIVTVSLQKFQIFLASTKIQNCMNIYIKNTTYIKEV